MIKYLQKKLLVCRFGLYVISIASLVLGIAIGLSRL